MISKEFLVGKGYLHIPVRSDNPETFYYIDVEVDGVVKNEFLIGIALPNEKHDFYVAMDLKRYNSEKVKLICRDDVNECLFDGIIAGGPIETEKLLYPDLYNEEIRQQIHFSPKRGWMNDPNGLFYNHGVFNMYFQHNPFANHHYSTNVSWGLARSTDGVHFEEIKDVLMPRNSKLHIASGSALIDKNNISGLGDDVILAAYTDLFTVQYHGRPEVTTGGCQNLLYSTDGGLNYTYLPNNPIINVPDYMTWRDPKILQVDDKTLVIAVYETYDNKNCVSFYKSTDCKTWDFCSRNMDLYECPDLFKLKVSNSDEELWVLYGASGKYQIGRFEDFCFKALTEDRYLDYGDSVYAGQTFNNYCDDKKRIYTAWLRDHDHDWLFHEKEPNRRFGFAQSMALFTELTIFKENDQYHLFRKPLDSIKKLRMNECSLSINGETQISLPMELEFDITKDTKIYLGNHWFKYDENSHSMEVSTDKKYSFVNKDKVHVRMIFDTRSAEIYMNDEVVISFFVKPDKLLVESVESVFANKYLLESIW
jgi:fructan beta-fructosidase